MDTMVYICLYCIPFVLQWEESWSTIYLAKLQYSTNLDFPEIRSPISLPKRHLLRAQVV